MTISFPRALPAGIGFEPARFRLVEAVGVAGDRAGAFGHMETESPAWTIRFVTEPMTEDQAQQFEAWRETLRGGIGRVLVTQNVTCRPKMHDSDAAAAPAQDPGVVDSVSGTSVVVSGLSAALALKAGDLVGFTRASGPDTFRALARVAEDSAAGATTRTLSFTRPPRAYGCAAGATVVFENPSLTMTTPGGSGSFSMTDDDFPRAAIDLVEVMK